MEKDNPNVVDGGHDVKTFISYDSPLRGANISFGLQGFINHFGNYPVAFIPVKNFIKNLKFGEDVLSSPAARQMLYMQMYPGSANGSDNIATFQNDFQTQGINSDGKLLKCSHKAIANGSVVGTEQFAPGTTMFSGKTPFLISLAAFVALQVNAMPAANTSGYVYNGTIQPTLARLLFGPILLPKSTRKVFVVNSKPYDSAPGGKTALGSDKLPGFVTTFQSTSCFIPTVSALDIKLPEGNNLSLPVNDVQALLNQNITNIKSYDGARGVIGRDDNTFRLLTVTDNNGDLVRIDDAPPSGPDNQDHVSLSYRNTGYLLYELTTRSGLSKVNGTLNSRTYNFGTSNALYSTPAPGQLVPREVNNIINYNLTVSDVGKIWVNRKDKIEFTDVPTNPDNTLNTRYNLHLKNQQSQACGNGVAPSVTLQNGGKMKAGDDLQGNYANVTVWSGATINVNAGGEATYEGGSNLIVESGGVVNIRDGGLQDAQWGGKVIIRNGGIIHVWNGGQLRQSIYSLLEIESGGQLIIDAGANVQLWDGANGPGGNSTIDGRCGIIVKTGGQLIVNGQFNLSGNGYFRFEAGHIFTLNSDITLSGYSQNVQMIRIASGASIVINDRRLTLANGLIRRESGSTPSKYITLINGSSIQATNVTFEDNSNFGDRAFVYVENPSDPDGSITDVDYGFTNCVFNNVSQALQLNTLNNVNYGPFEWYNLNVDFTGCTFNGPGLALNSNRCRVAVFLNCVLNSSSIIYENAYWLDMRNTTMRGNQANIGIKLNNVVHGEVYDNSTIDNYSTGIDASQGFNYGVKLMSGAKVQNCFKAVNLLGGLNNQYGYDWGMMYMDCASLINNVYGITGIDIQFNMYGRPGDDAVVIHNVVNPDIAQYFPNWHYVDAHFQYRNFTTDVWFSDSYWTGGVAPNTATRFKFTKQSPQNIPWTGTIHLDNSLSGGEPVIDQCGGLGTRGGNPFDGKSDIILNGGRYNTKVQHDAAMVKMRKKKFDEAITLFTPLAHVPKIVYEISSPEARHFIDNARIWVSSKGLNPRGANKGWLPEAFVGFTRKIDDLFILKPNPVNTEFEIQLLAGSYEISVYDALGKLILLKNTEGVTQVNTADWQNGIYFVKVNDKSSNIVQNSKVIVQH